MPNGGKLTINLANNGDYISIDFEDTCVGIAKEIRTKIFTPLFTTKSKGQGFGLAVCKKIIEAHGGEIMFQSIEGQGTTFTIHLPLNKEMV